MFFCLLLLVPYLCYSQASSDSFVQCRACSDNLPKLVASKNNEFDNNVVKILPPCSQDLYETNCTSCLKMTVTDYNTKDKGYLYGCGNGTFLPAPEGIYTIKFTMDTKVEDNFYTIAFNFCGDAYCSHPESKGGPYKNLLEYDPTTDHQEVTSEAIPSTLPPQLFLFIVIGIIFSFSIIFLISYYKRRNRQINRPKFHI